MGKTSQFLKRQGIEISLRRYGIDALGAMAQGLFCSLLIGTILDTLGTQLGLDFLVRVGEYASAMSGPAMAIAIGWALKAPPLALFSLATAGYAANALGSTTLDGGAGAGGPLAVLFIAILAAEAGKAVSKLTKVDILVTPLVTILVGVGLSALLAPAIGTAATAVGGFVMLATDLQPFLMGVVVSVVIGVALTLPISSAAICAAFGLTGLAGGAAVAGCCANMVGFAVLSFRENRWGGLVSQGLGTSMLQMGNIVKNPRIWLPAILTSAITGPLATCVFHFQMNDPAGGVAAGMGTCGLVGPIGVYAGWVADVAAGVKQAITAMDWVAMALLCFLLPGVLSWAFGLLFRRLGWIRPGDLALD
ncbi:MAG TPA: PTS sugar transporter subunit IIC [Candidatus Enterenecus merdae]|nr:PTS sugar transporter subunit IIC [Candidatus Enterenecus merdae]